MDDKLILICSDKNEGTTDLVCQWLNSYNKKFLRISNDDLIEIIKVEISNKNTEILFNVNSIEFNLSDIKSYWYRRSSLNFKEVENVEFSVEGISVNTKMSKALKTEYKNLISLFLKILHEKAKLNTHYDNGINKLETLMLASKRGLTIPGTIITQSKSDVNFDNPIISKAIGDLVFLIPEGSVSLATTLIDQEKIDKSFFYSCFQDLIDKKYELRIFYAFDEFYASVIFSQKNEKTKVDFRNYDFDFPNRVTPYRLPEKIEQKLRLLMRDLGLKSGSIDIAVTNENDFVLFEVNPVGQFEQVSFPCNFNIHQLIAQKL